MSRRLKRYGLIAISAICLIGLLIQLLPSDEQNDTIRHAIRPHVKTGQVDQARSDRQDRETKPPKTAASKASIPGSRNSASFENGNTETSPIRDSPPEKTALTIKFRVSDWGNTFLKQVLHFHIVQKSELEHYLSGKLEIGLSELETEAVFSADFKAFQTYSFKTKLEGRTEYVLFATNHVGIVLSKTIAFKTPGISNEIVYLGLLEKIQNSSMRGHVLNASGAAISNATVIAFSEKIVNSSPTVLNHLAYRHAARLKSKSTIEDLPQKAILSAGLKVRVPDQNEFITGTDENGAFHLKTSGIIGKVTLAVIADGYIAQILTPGVHDNIVFRLDTVKRLTIKVLSPDGRPCANTKVMLTARSNRASWNFRSNKEETFQQGMIPAFAKTDKRGMARYESISLPQDYCYLWLSRPGCSELLKEVKLLKADQSVTLKLIDDCSVYLDWNSTESAKYSAHLLDTTTMISQYFDAKQKHVTGFPAGPAILDIFLLDHQQQQRVKSIPVDLLSGENRIKVGPSTVCDCDIVFTDSAGRFLIPELIAIPLPNLGSVSYISKDQAKLATRHILKKTTNGYITSVELLTGKQLLAVKFGCVVKSICVNVPQKQYCKLTVNLRD